MKILMIIAQRDFKDEEFQVPYSYFTEKGYVVDVSSETTAECFGVAGTPVTPDVPFDGVKVNEYSAIVIVGGPGAPSLVGNPDLDRIITKAYSIGMVVAAICFSPVVLARAGILKGKKATVWDGNKKQRPILEAEGATYAVGPVVEDGTIITADGPAAAQAFAEKIVERLECDDCWMT